LTRVSRRAPNAHCIFRAVASTDPPPPPHLFRCTKAGFE
jgi:hypothetical protein